jgi:hypothetical protein
VHVDITSLPLKIINFITAVVRDALGISIVSVLTAYVEKEVLAVLPRK